MHPDLHWILPAGALQVWLLCSNMLGEENAYLWRTSLYLPASAGAEFFADIALAPMEAVKV